MSIPWNRLRKVCMEMSGTEVRIHGSTELDERIVAAVATEHDGSADIVLNLNRNKTLDDVEKALAHEMAHVLMHKTTHGPDFEECRKKVLEKLRAR